MQQLHTAGKVREDGVNYQQKTRRLKWEVRYRIKTSKINGVFAITAGWVGGQRGRGAVAINKPV